MLNKYNCTITPSLNSSKFSFIKQKESIERHLRLYRVLDKWFYFYKNDPEEPVIIWLSNDLIRLEPGTMRFTGVSLRQSNMYLNGILIQDENFKQEVPSEIKVGNFIESTELDFTIKSTDALDPQSEICKWAIKDATTLNSTKWYVRVFGWIRENVKHSYGLSYNNKIYYLNKKRKFMFLPVKPKFIVKVEDFKCFADAVIHLFNQVKKYENLN